MSKIVDAMTDFLERGGYNLGYDENEMPKLDDFDFVLDFDVQVWEYKGITEEQYYGGE